MLLSGKWESSPSIVRRHINCSQWSSLHRVTTPTQLLFGKLFVQKHRAAASSLLMTIAVPFSHGRYLLTLVFQWTRFYDHQKYTALLETNMKHTIIFASLLAKPLCQKQKN